MTYEVGDRIAFNSAIASYAEDWTFGTVTEVSPEGTYRIEWDDGYKDAEEDAFYVEEELRLVADVLRAKEAELFAELADAVRNMAESVGYHAHVDSNERTIKVHA